MARENRTQTSRPEPPVFQHRSPKTRHYLHQAHQTTLVEERKETHNMSTEQTFVTYPTIKNATSEPNLLHRFIAIKPDGVQRGLIGPIISKFENRGYKLVAMKLTSPSKEHLEKHYEDLSDKPFYKGLVTCGTHALWDGPKTMANWFDQTCLAGPSAQWSGKVEML